MEIISLMLFIGMHGTHAVGEEHLSSLMMSNEDDGYNNYVYDIFPMAYFHGGASADIDLDGDLDIFVAGGNTKVSGKNSYIFGKQWRWNF